MLDRRRADARRCAARDFVFHLAANADVRFGTEHPRKRSRAEHDRARSTCSRRCARTASRGSRSRRPARSTASRRCSRRRRTRRFPMQTSLYGASKLAGEGLIQAYCEGFGFQGYIFRFVSILGERYTHGHVFDFYQQPAREPARAARARQRPAAQVVPLRAGLHRRDAAGDRARDGQGQRLQPRHRRVLRGQRLDRLDLPSHLGVEPGARLHRRRARLDRRQPVHLSRHARRSARSAGRRS